MLASQFYQTLKSTAEGLKHLDPALKTAEAQATARQSLLALRQAINQSDPALAETVFSWPETAAWTKITRHYHAQYVCQSEKDYTRQLLSQPNPQQKIQHYGTFSRMQKIIQFERSLLTQYSPAPLRRILFAGSGAVPWSAVLLAQKLGLAVDCVDIDSEAVDLSNRLFTALDLSEQLTCYHSDIMDYQLAQPYDVVYVAALVGQTTAVKTQVLRHLSQFLPAGQCLLVRTSHGLRALIYAPLNLVNLPEYQFQPITPSPPPIVQTSLIGTKL